MNFKEMKSMTWSVFGHAMKHLTQISSRFSFKIRDLLEMLYIEYSKEYFTTNPKSSKYVKKINSAGKPSILYEAGERQISDFKFLPCMVSQRNDCGREWQIDLCGREWLIANWLFKL